MSSEVIDELDALRAEIAEAARLDPELRSIHQQTRAAFAVAESLAALVDSAEIGLDKLARTANVPPEILESAINATPGSEIPVETIRRLAQVLQRQFEILMHPTDGPSPPESSSSAEDESFSRVRIRFPMLGSTPRRSEPTRQTLELGIRELVRIIETKVAANPYEVGRAQAARLRDEVAAWPATATPLSFLVGVADAAGYSIRLGFLDTRFRTFQFEQKGKSPVALQRFRSLPSYDTESEFRFMSIPA